jgi:hypothetical protein
MSLDPGQLRAPFGPLVAAELVAIYKFLLRHYPCLAFSVLSATLRSAAMKYPRGWAVLPCFFLATHGAMAPAQTASRTAENQLAGLSSYQVRQAKVCRRNLLESSCESEIVATYGTRKNKGHEYKECVRRKEESAGMPPQCIPKVANSAGLERDRQVKIVGCMAELKSKEEADLLKSGTAKTMTSTQVREWDRARVPERRALCEGGKADELAAQTQESKARGKQCESEIKACYGNVNSALVGRCRRGEDWRIPGRACRSGA